jgi:hypothetical protein
MAMINRTKTDTIGATMGAITFFFLLEPERFLSSTL